MSLRWNIFSIEILFVVLCVISKIGFKKKKKCDDLCHLNEFVFFGQNIIFLLLLLVNRQPIYNKVGSITKYQMRSSLCCAVLCVFEINKEEKKGFTFKIQFDFFFVTVCQWSMVHLFDIFEYLQSKLDAVMHGPPLA